MNKKIEKIKKLRLFLLGQLDSLTDGQLNAVPAGFSNNIIWNLGHQICVAQNLCYVRAGLPVTVDDQYFSPYLPGTRPERIVSGQEIKTIKEVFISLVDQLQSDFDKHVFSNYHPPEMIPKVYGFEVSNIDEAIDYLLYHEGFHGRYILSLKHLLSPVS